VEDREAHLLTIQERSLQRGCTQTSRKARGPERPVPGSRRRSPAPAAGSKGFAPVVGTKFRLLARPKPGWNGVVDCEVLEVNEPSLLRYSWTGDQGGDVTQVVYRLEPHAGGTASATTTPASPASAESSWPRIPRGVPRTSEMFVALIELERSSSVARLGR
jgi:hypothetical protein